MTSWNSSHPIHLQAPAVDVRENRLPQYHPAFAPGGSIQYNPEDNELVAVTSQQYATSGQTGTVPTAEAQQECVRPLPSDVEDMQFWGEIWPKAIERLKNGMDAVDPGHEKKQFSMRDCKTWKEVADTLKLARVEYDGKDGKWTDKVARDVKKAGRKIGKTVASPVKKIVKIVPENTIATPILNVVSLLMDAWQEAANVSEEVSSNIDDLSTGALFEDMNLYYELFRTDQNISKALEDLLLTIFKAVEGAIGFYISRQVQRLAGYVFKGEEYKAALRKNLAKIKTDSDKLDAQAKKSFMFLMLQERRKVNQNPTVAVQATNNFFYMISGLEHPMLQQYQTHLLSAPSISTSVYPSRTPSPVSPSGIPIQYNPPYQTMCTPQDLCRIIDAPFCLETEDIEAIFGRANVMDSEDRGRAEQVVNTPQFHNWMYNHNKARLMVQGNFGGPSFISPLSILCGTLYQTLRVVQPRQPGNYVIGLVFFCGRHARDRDSNETSAGVSTPPGADLLLRSLIGQLLIKCPQVCPPILPDLDCSDLKFMCIIFSMMVRQLPANTTLMIFIDGFNFYLSGRYWEGMEDVLGMLLSWVVDPEEGENAFTPPMTCAVRLLLTCPQPPRPRKFVRLFRSRERVLNLQNMHDQSQGPTRSGITGQLENMMSGEDGSSR